ncbi:MAG: UbiA prenyltransferase family protein [Gloeobacteraceae cyanobacterium ES-bin-316]|nr:UbiA prenyltransferase family protein [Ferruginibacter sp.]
MPVYWFALSQVIELNKMHALLIFIILHLLVYPSSNGYNSYMDRDTQSVGGIKNPLQPTRQLFYTTIALDMIALLLSLVISFYFFAGILIFIAASRAYSYRGIRLKQYPIAGYLTVLLCQGALVFFLVKHGASQSKVLPVSWSAMIGSSLLIGAFYPLTQIYQHVQDAEDGVTSISAKLGYRGTFVFSAIVFMLSMTSLAWYFGNNLELDHFLIMQICMFPALVYFFWWMKKVFSNQNAANFKNTMVMNIIGSVCSNAAFMSILILNKFE